ncbi:MAG: DUF2169 domain-containing protein [Polyangiaceae bacterium]
MEIRSLVSLPMGLVSWSDPAPVATVIVKATYSLEADRDLSLCRHQESLGLDQMQGGELVAPTDFVPRKALADIMVVGDAYPPVGQSVFTIRLAGPGFNKQATARLDAPPRGDGVPLTRATNTPLGPQSWWGRRDALREALSLSPEGPPIAPLPATFDYAFFNAAPTDQRVAAPPPGASIWLESLLKGRAAAYVRLPSFVPTVFRREGDSLTPLSTVCDTLLFDTRRGLAILTFRALVRGPAWASAVVALTQPGVALPAEETQRILASAPIRPMTADALKKAKPPVESREVKAVNVTVVGDVKAGAALPFSGVAASPPPKEVAGSPPNAPDWRSGTAVVLDYPMRGPATPFVPGAAAVSPVVDSPPIAGKAAFANATLIGGDLDGPATPFQPPASPNVVAPWPANPAPLPAPAPFNFTPAGPAPSFEVAQTSQAPRTFEAPLPPPMKAEDVRREPTKELTVEEYARLVAELQGALSHQRDAILRRHDLTEDSLLDNQRRIERQIRQRTIEGDHEALAQIAKASADARRGAAAKAVELTVDAYTRVKAEVEMSASVRPALERNGLTPSEWEATEKSFRARASADPRLQRQIAEQLRAARKELALRRARR